jgi:hypothetical protein
MSARFNTPAAWAGELDTAGLVFVTLLREAHPHPPRDSRRQERRQGREQAERRLTDALRRLIAEDLSIRESAERVGVAYHAARSLLRAADVADPVRDENVGGQT